MILRVAVQAIGWIGAMGLLLFVAAGTWRWPEAWVFLGLYCCASILFCAWLMRTNPALLAQRAGPVLQKGQPLWDRIFLVVVIAGWNVWLVVMALDAQRFQLSHVAIAWQVAGAVLIIIGYFLVVPVFRANSFAAPVVRVQEERDQQVIDTGPYALVRHPLYAVSIVYLLGIPLLLGSWYGLVGSVAIFFAMSWRATKEEQMLSRDLQGYAAYMKKVPWRLIPYVW